MKQRIIRTLDDVAKDIPLGEKPYKVMAMNESDSEISIPDFYVIKTDGSGSLTIDDSLREAHDSIEGSKMQRSAHVFEGGKCSFAGGFKSIRSVNLVESDGTDAKNLADCYEDMVEHADPNTNSRVQDYIETFGVEGFDPKDMDVLVMAQRNLKYHAMFLTGDSENPDLMNIHFRNNKKRKNYSVGFKKSEGRLITNMHERGYVPSRNKLYEVDEGMILEFAENAAKIEELFGKVQQVEMGYTNAHGVEVFQSRDFSANPSIVNKQNAVEAKQELRKKNTPDWIKANGVNLGYEGWGVSVSIDNPGKCYGELVVLDGHGDFAVSSYRDLYMQIIKERGIDLAKSPNEEIWEAKRETQDRARSDYLDYLRDVLDNKSDYILINKDPGMLYKLSDEKGLSSSFENFNNALNKMISNAAAHIIEYSGNPIRHEHWLAIEKGQIQVVCGSRSHEMFYKMFSHSGSNYNGQTPFRSGDMVHLLAEDRNLYLAKENSE